MLNLNIRQKVVLTTLIAVVLAISIVSAFSINSSRSIILEGTLARELPAILGEVANDIDTQLQVPITVSRTMANTLSTRAFVADESLYTEQQVIQYLHDLKQEFSAITAFIVSSQSGHYFTPDGLFKTISRDDTRDQWFYRFISSGQEYELSLDVDESTQVPTLFINYLLSVEGQPSAAVGLGLSLKSLVELIQGYRLGEHGIVYLVDGDGEIKVHPSQSQIGQNLSQQGDIRAELLLQKRDFSSQEYSQNGDDMMVATRYLPDIGWYLVVEVPGDEVFSALNESTRYLILVGLIIAVVFMLFSASLISKLISPFSQMAEMLEAIGQGGGDLTRRLDDSRNDEVGQMASGYNNFVSYLSGLLQRVADTSQLLLDAIARIDQQAKNMADEISEQVSKVEQVATAMHEMGMSAGEIAESAVSAADTANLAEESVAHGAKSVNDTISRVGDMNQQLQETSATIEQLEQDTNSIDQVLEVIRGVSEQTNLLALNAAIEAARAGEQGRGFSVVADEVRTLASRSHASTEEIRSIIEKLQDKTGEVVAAIAESTTLSVDSQNEASHSGEYLQSISTNIGEMNSMNLQIASATEQQSKVVNEINPHITSIADIARENSEVVKQTSEDCSQVMEMAEQLNEQVSRFKF